MTDETKHKWLQQVDERMRGSEPHRSAAQAILQNGPLHAEHVDAADDLVRKNLAFPPEFNASGYYEPNLRPW